MNRSDSSAYLPSVEDVDLALARVWSTEDVVRFVSEFGLLDSGSVDGEEPTMREPVSAVVSLAEDLRGIFRTARDVRRAAAGNAVALDHLRGRFSEVANRVRKATDDRSVLLTASEWGVSGPINNGLVSASPYMTDRAFSQPLSPGSYRFGVLPDTLRQVCYMQAALRLSEREPFEVCEECGRPFRVTDARQRFCSSSCASRTRSRRFSQKQKQSKGERRGQTRKG